MTLTTHVRVRQVAALAMAEALCRMWLQAVQLGAQCASWWSLS